MGGDRPGPALFPTSGSKALAADTSQDHAMNDETPPSPSSRRGVPFQPNLFSSREIGRVVPIEVYQPKPAERRKPPPKLDRAGRPGDREGVPPVGRQGSLFTSAGHARQRHSGPEPVRYTNAPVAVLAHRLMAALIDASIVTLGVGAVAIVIYLLIGADFLRGNRLSFLGGLGLFFGLGYKLLWAMAGSDSPGLRAVHLRTLDFDGRVPAIEDRISRLAWSCFSILPGGLGLIWALFDQEKLTWHDHSSKTFITLVVEAYARRA